MRLVIAIMSALSIAAAGCRSVEPQKRQLDAAKTCCQGAHEFRYTDLPETADLRISISDKSPVFEFPSGRSYFEAVRLGRAEQAGKIHIKIYASNIGWWQLCPSLTFLSARYETIQTRYETPRLNRPMFGYASYSAEYKVPAGTVYAVIHSEADRIGDSLPRGARSIEQHILGLSTHTSCAPTGDLTITRQNP
jgi:maltose operon periplasmic protein